MASNTGTLVYNETMSKLINCLHLFECPVNWSKYSLLMSLSYTLPLQIANQQFVLQLHDMGNRALLTLDARAYLFCEPWLIRLGGWLPLGNNFFNIESLILCFLWRSFSAVTIRSSSFTIGFFSFFLFDSTFLNLRNSQSSQKRHALASSVINARFTISCNCNTNGWLAICGGRV